MPQSHLLGTLPNEGNYLSANYASHNNYGQSMSRRPGVTGSGNPLNSTGGGVRYDSVVEDQRRVSSVIVKEEYLQGKSPQQGREEIKYVEVPFIEEVVRTVPRKEIIEVEKRVPKIEYQYVDKTVEVPRIEYVDRIVEVPKYEEDVRYVPKPEYVDVPKEVIEEVPVIEKRVREEVVEVPGQVIEVPRKQIVEHEVVLPRYVKEEQPVVIAQTLRPQFVPSREIYPVEVNQYEAEIVEVEVPIAKIVDVPLRMAGIVHESHFPVEVSAAQYNSILRILNPHITHTQLAEAAVMRRDGAGFPELRPEEARRFAPIANPHDYRYHHGPEDTLRRPSYSPGASSVPLRPVRPAPVINASPPYASNVGINASIATFPAYESSYYSVPRSRKRSRRHRKGK